MKRVLGVLFFISLLGPSCNNSEDNIGFAPEQPDNPIKLTSAAEVKTSTNETYRVGVEQITPDNQNPFVEKISPGGELEWRVNHENTSVDGRAIMVAIDNKKRPWVVFTLDGGSSESTFINSKNIEEGAFDDVYSNEYGQGGGSVVSVIARINPENGNIVKGTFISARLNNGDTNSFRIQAIGFNDSDVVFESLSAAWPPGIGTLYDRLPDVRDEDRVNGEFRLFYIIKDDLTAITEARLRL